MPKQKTDILIISKNNCDYCDQLKQKLDREGLFYRDINAEEDQTIYSELGGKTAFNYVVEDCEKTAMPTVIVTSPRFEMFWQGSRPDKIIEMLKRIKDETNPVTPEQLPKVDAAELSGLLNETFGALDIEPERYTLNGEPDIAADGSQAVIPLLRHSDDGAPDATAEAVVTLKITGAA